MFMYGGFRYLYYLSEERLVYSVNCCTIYANIVTQYTLVFLVYFGSSTITKTIFTKCCMEVCSIQNILLLLPR